MTLRNPQAATLAARGLALAAGLVLAILSLPAHADPPAAGSEDDPWEPFNRGVFWFNDQLDGYVVEPVARGWDFVMPKDVQTWIDNFFDNVHAPIDGVNALLQGKPRDAGVAFGRFLFNSTVGFAGFFDPAASELGLDEVREDFGQTLAVWGLGSGPYLVLPSSARRRPGRPPVSLETAPWPRTPGSSPGRPRSARAASTSSTPARACSSRSRTRRSRRSTITFSFGTPTFSTVEI